MRQLPERKPHTYAAFQKGFYVMYRSDTPWSNLEYDLLIKQILMHSNYSKPMGLTRDSGFSKSTRALWVLSMPASCEFNLSMHALTRTAYSTS